MSTQVHNITWSEFASCDAFDEWFEEERLPQIKPKEKDPDD